MPFGFSPGTPCLKRVPDFLFIYRMMYLQNNFDLINFVVVPNVVIPWYNKYV